MKLMTLNLWGGRLGQPLFDFIKAQAQSVDIFCFQEVYNSHESVASERSVETHTFSMLAEILTDFEGFFSESMLDDIYFKPPASYGIAMFARKTIAQKQFGVHEIFQLGEDMGLPAGVPPWHRLLQFVQFELAGKTVSVFNLHGMYTGGGKLDTPARIKQSTMARKFMSEHAGEHVLAGDFNLDPSTESYRIISDGLHDLVKESGTISTRSSHYTKEPKFADYILTTPGIKIEQFEVLRDEVSDHLPLVLNFN